MGTQKSEVRNQRSAFTLVELLVVIAIIAVLASLILVGGAAAIRRARIAAISAEIAQLDSAFIEYTNDRSAGAYPPNLLTASHFGNGITAQNNAMKEKTLDDFKRHFNKAFPKHREPPQLLAQLAGVQVDSTGQFTGGLAESDNMFGGLSPYEAIVFWLGGFSDDPKYPISGPGGPSHLNGSVEDFSSRQPIFDFDVTRLQPRNDQNQFGGRSFTYDVNLNGTPQTRRVNLWVFMPNNREVPYAYFNTPKNPKFDPVHDGVVGIKQLKLNANPAGNRTNGDFRYANEGKCQILSAGLDDTWGPFADNVGVNYSAGSTTSISNEPLYYPDGPFTGEAADTITNFSTSATLEDSQP